MKNRAKCFKAVLARLFTQKYIPFSKMDKKNVQKRKPKILLCKNRGFLPFYFQFAGLDVALLVLL
jgi:hypothetical protein